MVSECCPRGIRCYIFWHIIWIIAVRGLPSLFIPNFFHQFSFFLVGGGGGKCVVKTRNRSNRVTFNSSPHTCLSLRGWLLLKLKIESRRWRGILCRGCALCRRGRVCCEPEIETRCRLGLLRCLLL